MSEGPNILLDKPIVLIGRHQECDIQIPSRKVSRRHCCVAQVNQHLVVRDLCSTNGIRINGVRVMEGDLKPGDELTIGSFKYQLSWPSLHVVQPPAAVGKAELPRIAEVEENGLDSCEEPMPLPEPELAAPKKAHAIPIASNGKGVDSAVSPELPSLGIPDDISLRPISESRAG